jgi:hypothetical protein
MLHEKNLFYWAAGTIGEELRIGHIQIILGFSWPAAYHESGHLAGHNCFHFHSSRGLECPQRDGFGIGRRKADLG